VCVCYVIDRVPATDGVCSDEPNQRSVFLFLVLFFLYANSIGIQFLNCFSRIFSRTPEDDTKIPPATSQILFLDPGADANSFGGFPLEFAGHGNVQLFTSGLLRPTYTTPAERRKNKNNLVRLSKIYRRDITGGWMDGLPCVQVVNPIIDLYSYRQSCGWISRCR
jgi:hypothetical protein